MKITRILLLLRAVMLVGVHRADDAWMQEGRAATVRSKAAREGP